MAIIDEQDYNKHFTISIWKKLFPYLKPFKKQLYIVSSIMLSSAAIDASLPFFQKYALDTFIANDTVDGIIWFILLYLSIALLQVVGIVFYGIHSMQINLNLSRDLKRDCFIKLQNLPLSYYNITPVGYTHTRVMIDTMKIANVMSWSLVDIFWQGSYVCVAFIAMLLLNYKLALVVLLIAPFLCLLTNFFQNKILAQNRIAKKSNSKITNGYNEGITGQKTSKTMVLEEDSYNNFAKTTHTMYHASLKGAMLSAVYIPTVLLISSCIMALVLWQGSNLVIQEVFQLGSLSVFIVLAISIFEPIQQLAKILADFISTQANIERVFDLLEQVPDIVDSPDVIKKYGTSLEPIRENWEEIRGDIEFKNVTFMYPDGHENVLENFNLKIKAGTTVAIVGETGAGKSTLVNLACRFFEPTSGEILIDDVDYRKRSMLWLHSNIGYVLQNPHLFSGTIKENILYGKLDATDDQVLAAAKIVSADKVVEKLKKGFDSQVGESGDMLSTGEKQVISFARAVLANPRIFVLDEATSSIDTHTERLIQDATAHLIKDRTSFVIAHRLSTIKKADLILVVHEGKIKEQGNHKELMKQKGEYYNLYQSQFEKETAAKILDHI